MTGFTGARIGMTGLAEIVLPSATVRLCDGGFIDWPSRGLFAARDAAFGTIGAIEVASEAVGDEAPGGRITLLPPLETAAAALAEPSAQGGAVRFWLAEYDLATGVLVGTPEAMFAGLIDAVTLSLDRGQRSVTIDYVSEAERLFAVREGNVLSTRFHQLAFPGELGFDHCTGAGVAVPWGVAGPGRGSTSAISGGSGSFFANMFARLH